MWQPFENLSSEAVMSCVGMLGSSYPSKTYTSYPNTLVSKPNLLSLLASIHPLITRLPRPCLLVMWPRKSNQAVLTNCNKTANVNKNKHTNQVPVETSVHPRVFGAARLLTRGRCCGFQPTMTQNDCNYDNYKMKMSCHSNSWVVWEERPPPSVPCEGHRPHHVETTPNKLEVCHNPYSQTNILQICHRL